MSHRYRLYPTPEQEEVLRRHCGEARLVWNLALEQFNQWRPGRAPSPGSAERFRQLAEARRDTWLGEGSSTVQQQALRDFDQALRNWRGGTHRRPRPRKRGQDDGFCVRDLKVRTFSGKVAELLVPKCGYVRFRLSRPLPADPGMARVTLDRAGRWHVSITSPPAPCEREPTGALVGIDRGVANSIATSGGEFAHAPGLRPKEAERARRLQKRLARQKKGSNRRQRTKRSLGRLRATESDRRRDWVEQASTELVHDHDVIAIERLRIRNMVRSAKGTVEDPGHNVRAKAGLNRAILGQGWGMLARRLKDKAALAGVMVVEVDPKYTSRTCRACGHEAEGNRESQAVFRCLVCGHVQHADTHAALNILERGMAALANPAPAVGPAVAGRGAGASGQAVKRQPGETA